MTAEQNKRITIEYNNALHKGAPKTAELINKYVEDQELKRHIEVFEKSFPGYTLDWDIIIAEGTKVFMDFIFQGVYKGGLYDIPSKDQKVSVPGMIIYEMENGKIVHHKMVIDSMALMEQIGAFDQPEAVTAHNQVHAQ